MTKSVGKDDLRKMMQKFKANKSSLSTSSNNHDRLRKYKISAKEQALIEEQKRQEQAEREREKQPPKVKPLPEGFFDAKPVKSILKNSSSSSSVKNNPTSPLLVPSAVPTGGLRKRSHPLVDSASPPSSSSSKKSKENEEDEKSENQTSLPEGFFDDPKQDAKARQKEYKDPEEEEWERFQKEINQEIDVAQSLVTEEQHESTIDRQIEEVDEQMRAWSKVSELEKKLKVIEGKKLLDKPKPNSARESDQSDSEELEEDSLFDWRTKS